MKLKRIRLASTIMCFAVASAAILGGIGMQSASAGITSNIVLESAGLAGTLSPGMFVFDGDDDVSATSDNVISFGSQNTVSETQLMLRSKLNMYSGDGAVSFVDMDLSADLINIPQGAAFVTSFGLSSTRSDIGETGTLEIYVENGGKAGVALVKESGREIIGTPKAIDSALKLSVNISVEKTVSVYNDDEILFDSLAIDRIPEGYFAMGYRGGNCIVNVTDVSLKTYSYETPANVNITGDLKETFDNDEYNMNFWESRSSIGATAPSYLMPDNGVLRFNNVEKAYFASKYKYSNFELNFDMLDVGYYKVDEDGNVVSVASDCLSVYFGTAAYDEDVYNTMTSGNYGVRIGGWINGQHDSTQTSSQIVFSGTQVNKNTGFKVNWMDDCNPYDHEKTGDRRTNIKIRIEDLTFKMWLKYEDESWNEDENGIPAITPIFSESLRFTPNGHIRFCTYGNNTLSSGGITDTLIPNFSLDNIEVINLDKDANLIQGIGFKSNKYDIGSDYEYTDKSDSSDLLGNRIGKQESKSGCGADISSAVMLLPVAFAAAGCFIVIGRKRK